MNRRPARKGSSYRAPKSDATSTQWAAFAVKPSTEGVIILLANGSRAEARQAISDAKKEGIVHPDVFDFYLARRYQGK